MLSTIKVWSILINFAGSKAASNLRNNNDFLFLKVLYASARDEGRWTRGKMSTDFKTTELHWTMMARFAKRSLLLWSKIILFFVLVVFSLPRVSKVPIFNFFIGSYNVFSDFSDKRLVINSFIDLVLILNASRILSETFDSTTIPVEMNNSGYLLNWLKIVYHFHLSALLRDLNICVDEIVSWS